MEITATLSLILLVSIYVNINLYIKYRKISRSAIAETEYNNQLIASLYGLFMSAHRELMKVDRKGLFRSTDEVGFIFNMIKDVVDKLQNKFEEITNINRKD